MKKMLLLGLVTLGVLIAACGSKNPTGAVIKSASAGNNLTVSIATSDGVLKHGDTNFTLSFTDASGKT